MPYHLSAHNTCYPYTARYTAGQDIEYHVHALQSYNNSCSTHQQSNLKNGEDRSFI